MNFKKILSVVLAAAMILSSVSVLAAEETFPCEITELGSQTVYAVPSTYGFDDPAPYMDPANAEKLDLDYAVEFKSLIDELPEEYAQYGNFVVDFEVSLDKDATAILAGQYDSWSENWVSVKAAEYTKDYVAGLDADVDGLEFKANEPVFVMKDGLKDGQLTYNEVLSINTFKCGIKFAYDAPNGVKATVNLCVFPVVATDELEEDGFGGGTNADGSAKPYYKVVREDKLVVETVEYTFNENALGITELTTPAEKVDALNSNIDTIVSKEDAAGAADIIASLDYEDKKNIKPEVIKAMVEANGEVVDADLAVYGNGANGTIIVSVDEAAAKEDAFENYDEVYDITAQCSVAGVKTEIDVPVLVAIPVADVSNIEKVLHLHDGKVEEINFTPGNGVIYIQVSKFSQYAIVLSNTVLANDEAELKFVARNDAPRGEAWFDLVLSGADTEVVKGFLAGEFTLTPSGRATPSYYALTAADDEISITYNNLGNGAREYLVNLDSFNKDTSYTVVADGVTEIILAKLVVKAYGDGMINLSDVSLRRFDYDKTEQNLEEAINVTSLKNASYDILLPTQELEITIDFNHATETANLASYQQMTLTITKDGEIVDEVNLGSDNTAIVVANNKYTYTKTLLANTEYVVTLEGLGYRTAEYPINLGEEDRTLRFWNNYEDNGFAMEFVGTTAKGITYNYNFLAGDIVMDNYIDIYDLSAVVSYFGENNLVGNNAAYAKYDLNRDGAINSIDVAILLTSWNK